MTKKFRPIISVVLLAGALAIGSYYLAIHRNLLKQLAHTNFLVILLVLVLYVVMFVVLALILDACLKICRLTVAPPENAKLNVYSLLINFFVPGQGGPAYRGVYLYKHYKLRPKIYIGVTLLYYAFYAFVSGFLLLVASRPWWQTVSGLLLIALISFLAVRKFSARLKIHKENLDMHLKSVAYLLLATILQAIVQISIYAVELHSLNSHIRLSQIITYTGAANLALFVALTPGAIGIRESFLVFSEHLHHVSSANIILANVIDRSVYLVFLLILIVFTVVWRIKGKLGPGKLTLPIKKGMS